MTREHKLALIVGFSLVLVLGVLLSDHLSARKISPAVATAPAGAATDFGASGSLVKTLPESVPVQRPSATQNQLAMSNGSNAIPGPTARPLDMPGDVRSPGAGQVQPLSAVHADPIASEQPATAGSGGLPVSRDPLKRFEVKEGDSIYRIAASMYGDGNLWTKIREYSGNKGKIGEGGEMRLGVTLLLPPKDVLLGNAVLAEERVGNTPRSTDQSGTRGNEFTMSGRDARAGNNNARTDSTQDQKADARTENKADVKTATYTVKDGDTLASIARRKLGSAGRVQDIVSINKGTLDDPNSLKVGMVIKLPSK